MFNQNRIKPLLNEIEFCVTSLEEDPDSANLYYQKACALLKLYLINNDVSRLNQALSDCNKAVKLDPLNPLYLIDRANLYVKTAQTSLEVEKHLKLANEDIEKVNNLTAYAKISELYIRDTLNSLIKEIDDIKNQKSQLEFKKPQ